jgi:hypothetical protein
MQATLFRNIHLEELSAGVNMEKVQALIDLSKISFARYDERRKYHWQISIAFWALIVGLIIKKSELNLPISDNVYLSIAAFLLYAFLWLRGVWVAGENDKRLGSYYRDEASAILHNQNHTSLPPANIPCKSFKFFFGFLGDPGTLQHILVTLILFSYLYYSKTPRS